MWQTDQGEKKKKKQYYPKAPFFQRKSFTARVIIFIWVSREAKSLGQSPLNTPTARLGRVHMFLKSNPCSSLIKEDSPISLQGMPASDTHTVHGWECLTHTAGMRPWGSTECQDSLSSSSIGRDTCKQGLSCETGMQRRVTTLPATTSAIQVRHHATGRLTCWNPLLALLAVIGHLLHPGRVTFVAVQRVPTLVMR